MIQILKRLFLVRREKVTAKIKEREEKQKGEYKISPADKRYRDIDKPLQGSFIPVTPGHL